MKKIAVVKLGSTITTTRQKTVDIFRIEHIAEQIRQLQSTDIGIVLVVSGAELCGEHLLKLSDSTRLHKQLLTGVGQAYLTAQLYMIFSKYNINIAQLLLTKTDLINKKRRQAIQAVLHRAIAQKIVVVINENDIVELNSFSGNDFLASEIALLLNADHLLLLTDVPGVYNKHKQVIETLTDISDLTLLSEQPKVARVGGITTKIHAGKNASNAGIQTFISHGETDNILTEVLAENKHIGTKIV